MVLTVTFMLQLVNIFEITDILVLLRFVIILDSL